MGKMNKNGRNAFGRFIQLSHWLMDTSAWKSLSPTARSLYLEIKKRYNGYNNGDIAFSEREAASAVGVTQKTIAKAFSALQDRGFISVVQKGSFSQKTTLGSYGRSTRWLLTEYPQQKPDNTHSLTAQKDFMKLSKEDGSKNKPRTENLPSTTVKNTSDTKNTEVKNTAASGKKYLCETRSSENPEVKNTAVYNIPSAQHKAPASGPIQGQAQQGTESGRIILKEELKQSDIFCAVGGFCKLSKLEEEGIEDFIAECATQNRKVGEIRMLALKAILLSLIHI